MDLPKIMTFSPTMEEFRNFSEYINKIEAMGAHKAGLAKVIPPKGWSARKEDYKNIGGIVIPCPITQEIQGRGGVYEVFNMEPRNTKSGGMTVSEFERKATSKEYATPLHCDADDLERRYWTNIAYNPPLYGADVSGSLYDPDQDIWNVGRLQTILDSTLGDEGGLKIEGVNTAYLYFGMWKSTFAWHTEDMDLYSINYLHFGAPKFWYTVPPKYGRRLERVAQMFFKSKADQCPGFLRHKCYLLSPTILRKFNVPFNKIIQEEGQFMITFPYAYHAGFNHGYNCAESTNFATERWIEYGKRCKRCYCIEEMVQIDMDSFVKKYQPEKYKSWINDEDVAPHPEDDEKRKVSRSLSLAGCSKKAGEQPSRRHPLFINFGLTPQKRDPSSKRIKRKLDAESVCGKEKFRKLRGKTLETALRRKLRKRSILLSCKKSMDMRAQQGSKVGPSTSVLREEEEEEEESHSKMQPQLNAGKGSGGRESSPSEKAQEISIVLVSDADGGDSAPPPSLVPSSSCAIRGRMSFLRTNQKRKQGRADFYTPLAERVKLRRASDSCRSSRSSSDEGKAPHLEKVVVVHGSGDPSSGGDAPPDVRHDPTLPEPRAADLADYRSEKFQSSKSIAPAIRRSSRNHSIEFVKGTAGRMASKSLDGSKGLKPSGSRAAAPTDPEEPQMPQLVPVSSAGDPRVLRSHHGGESCRSGKNAPTLDCFR